MTVHTTTNRAQFTGNGSTRVWHYTFPCVDEDWLKLYLTSGGTTSQVLNDYAVDLDAKTVTYPVNGAALTSSQKLTILREVPLEQTLDLVNQGTLEAESIEAELDEIVQMVQQLEEQLQRCIMVGVEETPPVVDYDALSEAASLAETMAEQARTAASSASLAAAAAQTGAAAASEATQDASAAALSATSAAAAANAGADASVVAAQNATTAATSASSAAVAAQSAAISAGQAAQTATAAAGSVTDATQAALAGASAAMEAAEAATTSTASAAAAAVQAQTAAVSAAEGAENATTAAARATQAAIDAETVVDAVDDYTARAEAAAESAEADAIKAYSNAEAAHRYFCQVWGVAWPFIKWFMVLPIFDGKCSKVFSLPQITSIDGGDADTVIDQSVGVYDGKHSDPLEWYIINPLVMQVIAAVQQMRVLMKSADSSQNALELTIAAAQTALAQVETAIDDAEDSIAQMEELYTATGEIASQACSCSRKSCRAATRAAAAVEEISTVSDNVALLLEALTGGQPGQVLARTANGYEWVDLA